MRRVLLHSFFLLCSLYGLAGSSSFDAAKKAYFEKDYDQAISLFQKEIKAEPNNPSLYFNLGLAYKASKNFPKAIWAFEKTLKLRPNDSEAIQLIDASYLEMDSELTWQSDSGAFLRNLFSLGSNLWSILAIVCSVLSALFIVRMRQMKSVSGRKIQLSLAIAAGIFLIFCGFIASASYSFEHEHNYAIVTQVEPAPDTDKKPSGKTAIQPGMKVKILQWNVNGKTEIETPYGQKISLKDGLARI